MKDQYRWLTQIYKRAPQLLPKITLSGMVTEDCDDDYQYHGGGHEHKHGHDEEKKPGVSQS